MSDLKSCIKAILILAIFASLTMAARGSSAAAPTIGPNINLSRAAGNQYETSVAINPKNNNQIFVVGRNEVGGLFRGAEQRRRSNLDRQTYREK